MKYTVLGLLLVARVASAQLTCNGAFELSYPFIGPFVDVGEVVTMRAGFGAEHILGGSALFVNNFSTELACNSNFPVIPCIAEAGRVTFEGNITTDCTTCIDATGGLPGVPAPCVWTASTPAGPNDVLFQLPPDHFLKVPELSPVPFCSVDFKIKKIAESGDGTPNLIEQNMGYIPSPTAFCPECLAVCDNFILASQVIQSSALLGAPQQLAIQCYEAPRRDTHKPNVTVTVTDQFGSDSVVAQRLHQFCAPTDLNGADPNAPQNPVHEASYVLGGVDSSKFSNPTVSVATVFGVFTMRVGNPTGLSVPTAKSVVPAPPPAPLVTPTNHYLCHRVSQVKGPNVRGVPVTVQDQFVTFTQKLGAVVSLCVPAQKNAEPIVDPTLSLLCFSTSVPTNAPVPLGVEATIINQFGQEVVDLTQTLNLCVAATVS